jgi:glucose/arabinose dehydrogenase
MASNTLMKFISISLVLSAFVIISMTRNSKEVAAEVGNVPSDSVEEHITPGSVELGISTVISGLDVPWDLAWADDNTIIFSEQGGRVSKVNTRTGKRKTILQIPGVWRQRTSGLLGLALHPRFKENPFLVLNYTVKKDTLILSKLVRYRYTGDSLTEPVTLLQVRGNTSHNGSRVTISPDGKVYWATGDGMRSQTAQNKDFLNGKILRLNLDGSIPADNPYPDNPVWSSGYRNMQGLAFGVNQQLYTSEHGEANDDEINLIKKSANYGWPNVAGFCDTEEEKAYCKTTTITEPLKSWTPTIAPAGIEYYDHAAIPEWQHSLLLTTLKENDFRILKLDATGNAIVSETILFHGKFGRLRDVCISPSGDVYISTSNRDWNPSPGFPTQQDDRIIRLFKIQNLEAVNNGNGKNDGKAVSIKEKPVTASGLTIYNQYCSSCHKPDGKGISGTFPPLQKSAKVAGSKPALIGVLLHGMRGKIRVKGVEYDQQMPSFSFLTDKQLADVLTYVRTHFDNKASAISVTEVTRERKTKK